MAKRQSSIQRLITFGMTASAEDLDMSLQALKAVRDSRFPSRKPAAPRKARSDKGAKRTPIQQPPEQAAAAAGD